MSPHQVHDDIGHEDLLERGAEGRHEVGGQLLDEAHRVGQQDVGERALELREAQLPVSTQEKRQAEGQSMFKAGASIWFDSQVGRWEDAPGGGVKRGEHEVLSQGPCAGERVEQRALARVGVAHEGHDRVAGFLAAHAVQAAVAVQLHPTHHMATQS